jgi:hypothetical protein
MRQYLHERHYWDTSTWETFDWYGFKKAIRSQPPNMHHRSPNLSIDGGMLGGNEGVSTSMTLFFALDASYVEKLPNMSSTAQDY